VDIVGKFTFRMDQVASSWTVGVLVEGGQGYFVRRFVPGYFHDDA
jgi:hypothetical protein